MPGTVAILAGQRSPRLRGLRGPGLLAAGVALRAGAGAFRPALVEDTTMAESPPALRLEPATEGDFEALLSLRLAAMRESLEGLGRFDPQLARERLSRGFQPRYTRHVMSGSELVGFVAVVPAPVGERLVLDHLYIQPQSQGRGIGAWVLTQVLAEADARGLAIEVTALKGSGANRFYQRHGFELRAETLWELSYVRPARRAGPAASDTVPGVTRG